MCRVDDDHYRVVKETIDGDRSFDDETAASLKVLAQRLRKLKKMNQLFDDVAFSSAVEKLLTQKDALMVCS